MLRRFVCLTALLLFTLMSAAACNTGSPSTPKAPAIPDPEGGAKPSVQGAKPG
jgi:hypothetical protein